MIKIRIEGTPEDIDRYISHMRSDDKQRILSEPEHYPFHRGSRIFERCYCVVELEEKAP